METLQGTLKGIILVVEIHKIVFNPITFFGRVILTFLILLLFWCSSISWETFNCYTSFLADVFGINQRRSSLKKRFTVSTPLPGAFLRYFGDHFGVCFSIFETCSLSYLIKFCTDAFCIILTVNKLRKISQLVSHYLGHYTVFLGLFWVYCSMLWGT